MLHQIRPRLAVHDDRTIVMDDLEKVRFSWSGKGDRSAGENVQEEGLHGDLSGKKWWGRVGSAGYPTALG